MSCTDISSVKGCCTDTCSWRQKKSPYIHWSRGEPLQGWALGSTAAFTASRMTEERSEKTLLFRMFILKTSMSRDAIHWIYFQVRLPGDMQSFQASSAALMLDGKALWKSWGEVPSLTSRRSLLENAVPNDISAREPFVFIPTKFSKIICLGQPWFSLPEESQTITFHTSQVLALFSRRYSRVMA